MLDGFSAGYIRGDVRIEAHPECGHWILTEKTRSVAKSKELWDCYQAIAEQLPARRVRPDGADPLPDPRKARKQLRRQSRR